MTKKYTAKVLNITTGKACDWYKHHLVEDCKAEVPWQKCGNKWFPCGWFLYETEWVTDEMRDFSPNYQRETLVAGPFSSEEMALAYMG